MASLNIDFSYDDNVVSSLKRAKSAINSRISDYNGIKSTLNGMSSSTSNLSTANSYITKKVNSLQDKYNTLDKFQTQITSFNATAENADKTVANKINTSTNNFYKRENIQTGIIYSISCIVNDGIEAIKNFGHDIVTGICSAWEGIKEFYQKHKYIIDLIVDVVCVVAAVVALVGSCGALSFVFAAWGFAKAFSDLAFDSVAAYNYYVLGDEEAAEELSNYGLKEIMGYYMGDYGEALYYIMEVASVVYSIGKLAKTGYKAIKDYKSWSVKWSQVLSPETFKAAQFQQKMNTVKDVIKAMVGLKSGNKLKLGSTTDAILSNTKFAIKAVQSLISGKSIGETVLSSVKIIKSGSDFVKNLDALLLKINNMVYINITGINPKPVAV